MVILAYVRDRRIRANVASLFILNLAITDLVVGTFMWPITLEWLIKDDWVHGEIFCKVWLIVDYTMTMVSALTLVMISWDRYCLLTMEMRYSTFQTKKRIGLIIVMTWTIVFAWYSILAFAWSPITGEYHVDYTWDCEMEFASSLATTLVANAFEFFIPFTALIILNIAVYRNIKQRSKGIVGQSPQDFPLTKSTARSIEDTDNSQGPGPSCPPGEGAVKEQSTRGASSLPAVETVEEYNGPQPDDNLPSGSEVPKQKKTDRQIFARHRKAAVVLGFLVGFFLICWVPIQVTSVMFAICGHNCVSYLNWEVTNALVWSNSMINPFIYAATNIHFRRNFRHFLLLDRWAWKVTPK
eukprot:XP_794616.1 PREDICTED: muscarinic acetylcholine receptor M5-like [Strongylocentrotus purpuratus]